MKVIYIYSLIFIALFFSCNKISIFKKNHFELDETKYKVDDYTATYFGPTLTRYVFESGENKIDLELSYCSKDGLESREYNYDGNDFDYRLTFYKDNGAIKKCKKGKVNISEPKPNIYEMDFDATMSGGILLTGFFKEKNSILNKENTFLYNNIYYPIDTVLVYQVDYYNEEFFEVYLFNDYNDNNAPVLGFLMFAYSLDELSGVVRDLYYDFIGIVILNETEMYDVSEGKIKTTFVNETSDNSLIYDFYHSISFNGEEKIIGDYVGDFNIQSVKNIKNNNRIQTIHNILYQKSLRKRNNNQQIF